MPSTPSTDALSSNDNIIATILYSDINKRSVAGEVGVDEGGGLLDKVVLGVADLIVLSDEALRLASPKGEHVKERLFQAVTLPLPSRGTLHVPLLI